MMSVRLGIVLDTSGAEDLAALAAHAERRNLDLVVIDGTEAAEEELSGLDPWTAAAWIAGRTDRIPIAVVPQQPPEARSPHAIAPRMAAKARETLDRLAGTRLVLGTPWVQAEPDIGVDGLERLGSGGLPVVVPVRAADDIDRLADLLDGVRAASFEPPVRERSVAVRSRRRPGIDYDAVPASLSDLAVEPGDPRFASVASTYLRGGAPGLVLQPRTAAEVADALAFARRHRHLPLGVRSGGHGISGRSTNTGGLVIDVGALNAIEILDPERRLVRIGPGATWKQVAAALDPYGWALGSGDYGGVGVGGLATAGGIGLLSRAHGLTIDHLRVVEVVLADGRLVRATPEEHPDLFWAMRGAGANFGVVTALEFEVDEIGDVGYAELVLVTDDIEDTLRRFGQVASAAPRDTTVFLVTGRPRHGQSVVQLYAMVDASDPDVIVERLTPFARLGALVDQQVVVTRYADVMSLAPDVGVDGHQGRGQPVSRSAFLPSISGEVAHDLADLLRGGAVYFFQLRAMGGAIADVPPDDTAFAHRTPAFQATAMGAGRAKLDAAWDALAHHFDGLYLSFDTDQRPERLADAFPPPTLEHLRALKRRYDPGNLFQDNFNIAPHTDHTTPDRPARGGKEAA
jgi:FAD/FMN-containing dehydrogenase